MKTGMNRKVANIEVAGKVFKIGMFPVICELLIIKETENTQAKPTTMEEVMENNKIEYALQFEMLENLLIANDYEFDRAWWELHNDITGIGEFISLARTKDVVPTKLKKKEIIKSH